MSLKICSIGDIMLGENVHHFGRGIATKYYGQFHRLIPPEVRAVANGADILVGNLECSLMPDRERRDAPLSRAMYAGPESALDCFYGLTPPLVLNLANNHFGQHGKAAMDYTVRALTDRGIHFTGREPSPVVLTVNGKRVCIWGVSLVEDKHGEGYVKSTTKTLLQDLQWGKKPDDARWIVSIHWGEEYRTQPSESQQELARALAEHGVDLILGHHPHVIQPVRYVKGIPVAYSHGNFLFDQNFSKLTRTGLMLVTELEPLGLCCHELRSRKYRIRSCGKTTENELETFCRRHMKRHRADAMRLFMKIEMIMRGYQVPKAVWVYFLARLAASVRGKYKAGF